jgi:transcriptional regulator with XRE-family HTH domain
MAQISPATCRAARGLVDLTQKELAEAASVGLSTVKAFEAGTSTPMANNLKAMQSALEALGVEFTNGGQPGVRLRKGE